MSGTGLGMRPITVPPTAGRPCPTRKQLETNPTLPRFNRGWLSDALATERIEELLRCEEGYTKRAGASWIGLKVSSVIRRAIIRRLSGVVRSHEPVLFSPKAGRANGAYCTGKPRD
jgi:hypothetical protein